MPPNLSSLQTWINTNFPSLQVSHQTDAHAIPYLKVISSFPHPVLVTNASVHINIYMEDDKYLTSKLVAYNMVLLREVVSKLQEEIEGEGKVRKLLTIMDTQQTSVCAGIAEETVSAGGLVEYWGNVLVEKYLNSVVVRARDCMTVFFDEEVLVTCKNCRDLKEKLKSSSGLEGNESKPYSEKVLADEEVDVKLEPDVQVKSNELDEHVHHSVFGGGFKDEEDENCLKVKIKLPKGPKMNCPEFGCKRKFSKYKTLVKHCKLKHLYDDIEMPVKLEDVKAEFDSIKKCRSRPTNDPNAPNKCPDCDKCFWTHKSLVKHCVKVHNKSKESCPKPDYEQYLQKKKAVSKLPDKYQCQFCPKMFKFSSSVMAHTKRYHTETKMVPCEHCGKEVKQSNMEMHFKNNHATPRFTCNQCGKSFYFKALMVSHINVMHEGVKNHICDLCGAKFGIRKSLERHVRCQHEDFRPFICEYCQKAFHTSQKLKKHISGHLKDKIYVCTVCEARFYYKDNVRMHMKKSHPDLDPKTECRVIDNPDSGSGQMIHSMETGRRMRLSSTRGSTTPSNREPDLPSTPSYSHIPHSAFPTPSISEPATPSSRDYSDNTYDAHREMIKSPEECSNRSVLSGHNLEEGERRNQHQQEYLEQTRPDLSSYLLGLRYNYAQYHHQQ